MKVKKIAALLLTAAILTGLCACSGKEAASAGEEGSSAETEQNETVGTVTEDKDTQGQEMNTGSGSTTTLHLRKAVPCRSRCSVSMKTLRR